VSLDLRLCDAVDHSKSASASRQVAELLREDERDSCFFLELNRPTMECCLSSELEPEYRRLTAQVV
jgi:hypothetical protein